MSETKRIKQKINKLNNIVPNLKMIDLNVLAQTMKTDKMEDSTT